MNEGRKTRGLVEKKQFSIIPLGTPCLVMGKYELDVIVASRTIGGEDGNTKVTLDFDKVPFTCSSDPCSQNLRPDTISLLARIYEGEEDTPQARLLSALRTLRRLQERNFAVYGDRAGFDNLNKTPIVGVELEGAILQTEFSTGRKYTPYVVIIRREDVKPLPQEKTK